MICVSLILATARLADPQSQSQHLDGLRFLRVGYKVIGKLSCNPFCLCAGKLRSNGGDFPCWFGGNAGDLCDLCNQVFTIVAVFMKSTA